MSDYSIAIVPKVVDYPDNENKAKEILDWLVSRDIIKPFLTDCILSTSKYGYAVSAGAKQVVEYPDELPFDLITNGLEIVTESEVFVRGELDVDDLEEIESNLGFIFWNWPDLKEEFVDEFSNMLGCEVKIVLSHI